MSRYRGLLFDKDGTLFDFASTWESWTRIILDRLCIGDAVAAAALGRHIGFDHASGRFAPDSIVIAGTAGQVAEALLPHLPDWQPAALQEVLNAEAARVPQKPAVPLAPLLGGFRAAGLALGLATNDAEAPARAHLEQAGILDFFTFIAGYDSGHGGKPAPGQMLAFAAQTRLAPAQIVMVGDSAHDLVAGRAAGMACVGVLTGLAAAAELAPHADAVLPDIGHLPGWLATAGG